MERVGGEDGLAVAPDEARDAARDGGQEEVRAVLAREDASGVREDALLQLFALGCDCLGFALGGERERVGVWWEEEDGCLEGAPVGGAAVRRAV